MYQFTIVVLGFLPWLFFVIASNFAPKTNVPSPLKIMAWTFLLGYTLKSVYVAYAVGNTANFKTKALSIDIIPLGQVCILISAASMILGYYLFFRLPKYYRSPSLASKIGIRWVYLPFFVLCLGLMFIYFYKMDLLQQLLTLQFRTAKFFTDESTGVKSSLGFLTMGSDFIIVASLFFALGAKKLRPYSLHIAALAFVCLCFMMVGRRNGVIIPIILALIVLPMRLEIFPSLKTNSNNDFFRQWRILGFFGVVLIGLSFVSQVRQAHTEVGFAELSITNAFSSTAEHTLEGAYFLDPAKTAVIINHTSENKTYLLGESFINFIYAPVPRILWPEKPNIKIGPYVAQEVLGFYNRSGAPPGGIGEFYLNFGWAGVVIGSIILGGLMALIQRHALSAANQPIGRIKYALYITCIILYLTTDFSGAILSTIRYTIALFICEMFWSSRLQWLSQNQKIYDEENSYTYWV